LGSQQSVKPEVTETSVRSFPKPGRRGVAGFVEFDLVDEGDC
jgi:hypothetical protein